MESTSLNKSGYANVNGINMYYEMYGAGFPLVLIHGGGSTITTSFGNIIPLLAKTHMVIAVELQAHGRTSDRGVPETFEQDAADVAALLNQLNIATADILGFSNGGQTAMQFAMSYPQKLRRLVLASTFYKKEGVPVPFWQAIGKATFADMPQVYKDEFLKVNNDEAALLTMFNRDAQRMQTFKDWSDADLQSIRAKTLVIAGDRDLALNVHSAIMAAMIPDCQLAILPGGHGTYLGEINTLVNGEWTQRYAVELIEQFLLAEA